MEKILLDYPWVIVLILLWTFPWKAAALWRAARHGQISWFLAILILNTLGILDILYIFVFSKMGGNKKETPAEGEQAEQKNQSQNSQSLLNAKGRKIVV